jgi:hypothetical protein
MTLEELVQKDNILEIINKFNNEISKVESSCTTSMSKFVEINDVVDGILLNYMKPTEFTKYESTINFDVFLRLLKETSLSMKDLYELNHNRVNGRIKRTVMSTLTDLIMTVHGRSYSRSRFTNLLCDEKYAVENMKINTLNREDVKRIFKYNILRDYDFSRINDLLHFFDPNFDEEGNKIIKIPELLTKLEALMNSISKVAFKDSGYSIDREDVKAYIKNNLCAVDSDKMIIIHNILEDIKIENLILLLFDVESSGG